MKKEREEKGTLFYLTLLLLLIGFFVYSYIDVAYPKTIKTEAVKNLKAELKEEKIITDMKCYYMRPDLNFEFKVKNNFEEEKLYEILNYLNEYVDSVDLEKVSKKCNGAIFNGINVKILKAKNSENYPEYKIIVDNNINQIINGYKHWQILKYNHLEEKYDNFDEVTFKDKE